MKAVLTLAILVHSFQATRADCTDPSGLGPVDDAPTSVLDKVIYVFPHICKFNSSPSPCHYECDTRDNRGWVAKTDPTTTISYIGASSCVAPAGTLNDDKDTMLIVGGGRDKTSPTRTVKIWDGATLSDAPPLAVPRVYAGSAWAGDKGYVVGGYGFAGTLSSIEVLESNNNNWGWRLLEVKMPTPRWGLSAVALADNVFAIGGHTGTSQGNVYSPAVEVLDTRTNTWKSAQAMSQARAFLATAILGCRIYAIGGVYDNQQEQQTKKVEVFSADSEQTGFADGEWHDADYNYLEQAVGHFSAVPTGEQSLLAIGGSQGSTPSTFLQVVEAPCKDPSRALKPDFARFDPGHAQCAESGCAHGYVQSGEFGDQCTACPGAVVCSACGGGGKTTGTFELVPGTTDRAQCTCAPHFQEPTCETCQGNFSGGSCEDCLQGHTGPSCSACPGLHKGIACSGHGQCDGDGTTEGDGKCLCDIAWQGTSSCANCSVGYYSADCIKCSCASASARNASACEEKYLCSGHGKCTEEGPCMCQRGWTGRECETRTQANAGDNNAATIVTAVLLAVVVMGAGYWYYAHTGSGGEADMDAEKPLLDPLAVDAPVTEEDSDQAQASYGTTADPSDSLDPEAEARFQALMT
eukprot:g1419.t1